MAGRLRGYFDYADPWPRQDITSTVPLKVVVDGENNEPETTYQIHLDATLLTLNQNINALTELFHGEAITESLYIIVVGRRLQNRLTASQIIARFRAVVRQRPQVLLLAEGMVALPRRLPEVYLHGRPAWRYPANRTNGFTLPFFPSLSIRENIEILRLALNEDADPPMRFQIFLTPRTRQQMVEIARVFYRLLEPMRMAAINAPAYDEHLVPSEPVIQLGESARRNEEEEEEEDGEESPGDEVAAMPALADDAVVVAQQVQNENNQDLPDDAAIELRLNDEEWFYILELDLSLTLQDNLDIFEYATGIPNISRYFDASLDINTVRSLSLNHVEGRYNRRVLREWGGMRISENPGNMILRLRHFPHRFELVNGRRLYWPHLMLALDQMLTLRTTIDIVTDALGPTRRRQDIVPQMRFSMNFDRLPPRPMSEVLRRFLGRREQLRRARAQNEIVHPLAPQGFWIPAPWYARLLQFGDRLEVDEREGIDPDEAFMEIEDDE